MSLNLRRDEDLPDPRPAPPDAPTLHGYVQPAELARTLSDDYPHLLPAPAADTPSFVDTVLDLLRPYVPIADGGFVVLVSSKHPRLIGEAQGLAPAPAFRLAPVERLVGRIFVVTNLLTNGYSCSLVAEEDVDVPSILVRLIELGLGNYPTFIGDLASGYGTWCPDGAHDDSRLDRIPLIEDTGAEPTTTATVVGEIDRLTAEWAVGGTMPPVWEDEERFVVATDAEKQLAETLYPVLRQRFMNTHRVHVEYNVVRGRTDVTLARLPGAVDAPESWVVGVDVVASYRAAPPGVPGPLPTVMEANEEALRRGIAATDVYRTVVPGARPICCAFDMQQEDDGGALIERIAEEARCRGVLMRRWVIPNQSRPSAAA